MKHPTPPRIVEWVKTLTQNLDDIDSVITLNRLLIRHPEWVTDTVAWHVVGGPFTHPTSGPVPDQTIQQWARYQQAWLKTPVKKLLNTALEHSRHLPALTEQTEHNPFATIAAASIPAVTNQLTRQQKQYCITHPNLLIRYLVAQNPGYTNREQLQTLTSAAPENTEPVPLQPPDVTTQPGLEIQDLPTLIQTLTETGDNSWGTWEQLLTSPIPDVSVTAAKLLPTRHHTTAIRQYPQLVHNWWNQTHLGFHKTHPKDKQHIWELWVNRTGLWELPDRHAFPAEAVLQGTETTDPELLNQLLVDQQTRDRTRIETTVRTSSCDDLEYNILTRWPYLKNQAEIGETAVKHTILEARHHQEIPTDDLVIAACPDWEWDQILTVAEQHNTHIGFPPFVKHVIFPWSAGSPTRINTLQQYIPLRDWVLNAPDELETYLNDRWPHVPINYLLNIAYHTDQRTLIDEACSLYKT